MMILCLAGGRILLPSANPFRLRSDDLYHVSPSLNQQEI